MEQKEKKLPELRKQSDIFKLIVPKEVEEKIRHLCRCCPTVEWSGKLFYKTEGSIANKDLVITCVDLYVMDIGTGGYTEFDETPDYFGYMVDKDLMECNIGLIHSHNNMATFFSGTDTQTLREEGNDNNHFVSLIVNNAGKYTAAVTSKVTTVMQVTATDSYRTFDDSEVLIEGNRTWEQTHETIDYYMLDIEKEEVPNVMSELDIRLNEIRTAKAKKKEENRKKADFSVSSNVWRQDSYNRPEDLSLSRTTKYYNQPSLFRDEELENIVVSEGQQIKEKKQLPEDLGEFEFEFDITDEQIANIVTQLITGSVLISNTSNIDLKKFVLSMENLYDKRFPNDPDLYFYSQWMENFIDFLFMENVPEGLPVEIEKQYSWELGMSLIDELTLLMDKAKNKYIETIIELLNFKIDY